MRYATYIKRGVFMGIGYRIKEARERLGLTQTELGNLVGVTGSAITNYEKETSHPKEQIIYKLMEQLNVDANYLFQDAVKIKTQQNDVTLAEYDMLIKYRNLDDEGQKEILLVLEKESKRKRQVDEIHARMLAYQEKIAEMENASSSSNALAILRANGKALVASMRDVFSPNEVADFRLSKRADTIVKGLVSNINVSDLSEEDACIFFSEFVLPISYGDIKITDPSLADVKGQCISLSKALPIHLLSELNSRTSQNVIHLFSRPDAAHVRTDIDIPEGTDTSDNDIMDDEHF